MSGSLISKFWLSYLYEDNDDHHNDFNLRKCSGQNPEHLRKFRTQGFQFFVGPGLATENGTHQLVGNTVRRIGYIVGAGITTNISSKIEMAVNFSYEDKGINQSFSGTAPDGIYDAPPVQNGPTVPTNVDAKIHKTFFTLSAIPQFKFAGLKNLRLGVGPFASLVNSYVSESIITQNGRKVLDGFANQKRNMMKYDFGFSALATYDFKISRASFFIGAMANVGIYNVAARWISQIQGSTFKEHTEAYYLIVGLRLPRKRE